MRQREAEQSRTEQMSSAEDRGVQKVSEGTGAGEKRCRSNRKRARDPSQERSQDPNPGLSGGPKARRTPVRSGPGPGPPGQTADHSSVPHSVDTTTSWILRPTPSGDLRRRSQCLAEATRGRPAPGPVPATSLKTRWTETDRT